MQLSLQKKLGAYKMTVFSDSYYFFYELIKNMINEWYFEFGVKNITHQENRKSIFCLKNNTIPIFTYFSQYSKYEPLNQ